MEESPRINVKNIFEENLFFHKLLFSHNCVEQLYDEDLNPSNCDGGPWALETPQNRLGVLKTKTYILLTRVHSPYEEV